VTGVGRGGARVAGDARSANALLANHAGAAGRAILLVVALRAYGRATGTNDRARAARFVGNVARASGRASVANAIQANALVAGCAVGLRALRVVASWRAITRANRLAHVAGIGGTARSGWSARRAVGRRDGSIDGRPIVQPIADTDVDPRICVALVDNVGKANIARRVRGAASYVRCPGVTGGGTVRDAAPQRCSTKGRRDNKERGDSEPALASDI